ncbi:MAG: hypothetical protein IJB23_03955 [Alistipes sp.]|nr:hypothetical protein [Alistipes sp.]
MRILVAIIALLMVGCAENSYVDMKAVDPDCWDRAVSIFYENEDTESLHNLSVALRYNSDFKADTLTVLLQTSLPDAHQFRERFTLHLRREYTAAAVTASETVPYRDSCLLNQKGCYIFTITPCRAVEGIEAVGIGIK